jgi:hypothetical protein
MRFVLFSLILLCLFAPLISSKTVTIFSDYIPEEESVLIDGYDYTAFFHRDYDPQYKYNDTVRLSSNIYGSLILEKNVTITKKPYTFYYSDFLNADGKYQYFITVKKHLPSLVVYRAITGANETPQIGDVVSTSVRLVNQGTDTIQVIYAENVSKEVHLLDFPEITVHNSTKSYRDLPADLYWAGVLYDGETVTISYGFKIIDYPLLTNSITFSDFYTSYKDPFTSYENIIEPLTFTLQEPLLLVMRGDTEQLILGANTDYELTLDNTDNEEISVEKLKIHIPKGTSIYHMDERISSKGNNFFWNGTIPPMKNITLSFTITPTYLGSHSMIIDATYLQENSHLTRSIRHTEEYIISSQNLTPEIEFDTTGFTGGNNVTINFLLKNNDSSAHYKDEQVIISSPLFEEEHYRLSFPKKKTKQITQKIIQLPYTDKDISYPIWMNFTSGGFWHATNKTLTVRKDGQVLPLTFNYSIVSINDNVIGFLLTMKPLGSVLLESLSVLHTTEVYEEKIDFDKQQLFALYNEGILETYFEIPPSSDTNRLGLDTTVSYNLMGVTHYSSFAQLIQLNRTLPIVQESGMPTSVFTAQNVSEQATVNISGVFSNESIVSTESYSLGEISVGQYMMLGLFSLLLIIVITVWHTRNN